jgi:predicted RNA-binding Zn ribbon-like protein
MGTEAGVPPAVALLRDFVNTREPQVAEDSLDSPTALRDWLAGRGLLPPDARLSSADLKTAVFLREGLREVLLAHADHDHDAAVVDALNRLLADRPTRVVFDGDGGYHLASSVDGAFDQAIGHLTDAVRQASEDGTWRRLKVCARDTCRWAFYDASRNQARRWCSMAGCGNHIKMQRAYAARKTRARRTA